VPSVWHLVIDPEGVVIAVTGGAPRHWVDLRLIDNDEVPAEVRSAAHVMGTQLHSADQRALARTVNLSAQDRIVHIVVLDAMPLRRVPTDLRALLSTTLAAVKRQARASDISLRVVVDAKVPPMLSLDPEKIAWVVVALVGNALRYVRSGSRLMPGGSIDVTATLVAGTEVAIKVHDDGPGMPAQTLARLFRRESRTSHRVGLGLALVHDIMVAHGGGVDVRSSTSAADRGTTIELTLPAW
jgi:signal transduction histidine kinase